MPEETAIATSDPEQLLSRLTVEERVELERHRRSGKPGLAPASSLKLYQLWVEGVPCQELAALNPGLSLGVIVQARVDHRWDERREAYLSELFSSANDRLKQIGVESLSFLGVLLAAAHKDHGERLKRYLQTGDPADLGQMHITSVKQYKDVVDTLARLTGADRPRTPQATAAAPQAVPSSGAVVEVRSRPMTPEEADRARALRLVGKSEEG